ncbi:MAG: hypothetical protein HYV07_19905 [Deltaproteobacteria bacterium]|nr:hypothetical protein [Deltaproteobacteria bacterium]
MSASTPTIVAVLPRGEAIRNFVYTGALELAAREAKVRLMTVVPNAELGAMLTERFGQLVELHEADELSLNGYVREILDMAHGRWLWSKAAEDRWRLRDTEATTVPTRLKRLGKKAAAVPFATVPGLAVLSRLEDELGQGFHVPPEYVRMLSVWRPSLVFNGSHVHGRVGTPAIRAAKALGIPTAAFIFSWDNLTSQGRIMPGHDYYLVWSEEIREQLLGIYPGVRSDRVIVTGTPQFDFHRRPEYLMSREELCAKVGLDPSRPFLLYSSGMANHMPGEPSIVEGIARSLATMSDLGPPQLLVRVYPKDRTGRFEELGQLGVPGLCVPEIPWEPRWLTPKPEDSALLTSMIAHSAGGINVASTVSLELAMFDKPVINVGYSPRGTTREHEYARFYEFDHYAPVVASGAIEVVFREVEMEAALRRVIVEPTHRAAGRRRLVERMFGSRLDGRGANRVAEALLELARRRGSARA